MKGYKVFNPDWTCRGFQYEVGKTYKHEGKLEICKSGFHFCEKCSDCFKYYDFDPKNKVAEVEATGRVVSGDDGKSATDEIAILREVSWEEVLKICNSGNCNSGNCNSGNCNSGNRNSGNCNSGNRNSGNRNSGDWNSGDWNSGDWNSGNCNSGFFNTDDPAVRMFNKDTGLKRGDISFPDFLYFDLNVWVSHDTATDEEKEEHNKEIETCGGFLKRLEYKEAFRLAWQKAS
ncbi:MAG: pentapeptide repeat-containing protein, partial [Lachnospiraceae bacterium]|nr:pentapeptide repeat-containing protein [Lachnospiraceae bacterium]